MEMMISSSLLINNGGINVLFRDSNRRLTLLEILDRNLIACKFCILFYIIYSTISIIQFLVSYDAIITVLKQNYLKNIVSFMIKNVPLKVVYSHQTFLQNEVWFPELKNGQRKTSVSVIQHLEASPVGTSTNPRKQTSCLMFIWKVMWVGVSQESSKRKSVAWK